MKKGFTLVELLVCIAIGCILLAIIYPVYDVAAHGRRTPAKVTTSSKFVTGLEQKCNCSCNK